MRSGVEASCDLPEGRQTGRGRTAFLAVPAAAAMLLWPAIWNGYPIVFADTGTYLSQAIHQYAGWDRPVFYSVFMLALHWTRTVWPVVIAQATVAAWMIWLAWRALAPGRSAWSFLLLIALLAVGTWLPWLTSELMPDLFTALLILALCLLGWTQGSLSRWQRWALLNLTTLFILTQQSSVPLAVAITLFILGAQWMSGWNRHWMPMSRAGSRGERVLQCQATALNVPPSENTSPQGCDNPPWPSHHLRGSRRVTGYLALPPILALLLVCGMNLVAHHRFALAPYGNVFLLARVIYDGPGMAALQRNCGSRQWHLCPYLDRFPDNADDFLGRADSPVNLAGGPKRVSEDADAIIAATLWADPSWQAWASLGNAWTQLLRFASGDGLQPWPGQVTPWILRDLPPREAAAYQAARQQTAQLAVPGWMVALHRVIAVGGVIVCVLFLVTRWAGSLRFSAQPQAPHRHSTGHWQLPSAVQEIRARTLVAQMRSGWIMTVLVALPLCAAITGVLSGPHDRYQARIMWLPTLLAMLALVGPRHKATMVHPPSAAIADPSSTPIARPPR